MFHGHSSQSWADQINALVVHESGGPYGIRLVDAGHAQGIAFSGSVAEALVRDGLEARLLPELAAANDIDALLLYEFAGIDRTTVARRSGRGEGLPHDVSVKAMEFTELMAGAVDVFESVHDAAQWLTRAHPLLDGQTPLMRARTPWGFRRVQGMLGALKYGAAA